jgi:hypothetical protein
MWNADMEKSYTRQVTDAKKQAEDNFSVVMDRTPAAVLDLPGAQAQVNRSKQLIEQAVQSVKQKAKDISSDIDKIAASKAQIRNDLNIKKGETHIVKRQVQEARELNKLRQEQAAELQRKYGSNLHTSYLGLWRPLAEQSHMGLIIAAAMFALIAIVSIVFIVRDWQSAPALPTVQTNQLFGGSSRRK